MSEYLLVEHWNLKEFVAKCNEKLAEGYTPLGGVSTAISQGNETRYTQAFGR